MSLYYYIILWITEGQLKYSCLWDENKLIETFVRNEEQWSQLKCKMGLGKTTNQPTKDKDDQLNLKTNIFHNLSVGCDFCSLDVHIAGGSLSDNTKNNGSDQCW